ncbi:MAG: phosphomannomutase, partial [Pseudomonadota bacterium]
GEINRRVTDAQAVLERIEQHYAPDAVSVDHTDGLSVEFENWRFNVRPSNTEPLLRLNVECREDEALLKARTAEVLAMIEA